MGSISSFFLTAGAHLSKILCGFLLVKLIAYYLGAEGLGALGHFMSLVAIVTMLAGGGIVNGIIKYVAEYRCIPRKMLSFISASLIYSAIFSILFFIVGITFSEYIASLVFGNSDYYWIIIILSIAQFGFAFTNVVTGVANGLRDTKTFAIIQIVGGAIGLPVIFLLIKNYTLYGAALSVIAIYFSYSIPALLIFYRSVFFRPLLNFKVSSIDLKKLSFFSLMLLTSSITFPVVEVLVRQLLIEKSGYFSAGIWQGSIKLSSAYLGFFSTFLAYYFMPGVSAVKDKKIILKMVLQFILVVAAIFIFGASILFFYRDFFIGALLSSDFNELSNYIGYQLIGDFFKITSYVIGFVCVAKAATKIYIFAEVFQSLLFYALAVYMTTHFMIMQGVFLGYMFTYIIYFIVIFSGFLYWTQKSK